MHVCIRPRGNCDTVYPGLPWLGCGINVCCIQSRDVIIYKIDIAEIIVYRPTCIGGFRQRGTGGAQVKSRGDNTSRGGGGRGGWMLS